MERECGVGGVRAGQVSGGNFPKLCAFLFPFPIPMPRPHRSTPPGVPLRYCGIDVEGFRLTSSGTASSGPLVVSAPASADRHASRRPSAAMLGWNVQLPRPRIRADEFAARPSVAGGLVGDRDHRSRVERMECCVVPTAVHHSYRHMTSVLYSGRGRGKRRPPAAAAARYIQRSRTIH